MALKLRVREIIIAAVAATLIGVPCLFWFKYQDIQSTLCSFSSFLQPEEDPELTNAESTELEGLLARVSKANRTVIITTLNGAWSANNTMIDMYLLGFHQGENIQNLLDHLVIITLDQKAHDRCLQLHPSCFMLKTRGVDFTGEKMFMTRDYLRMMWRRIKFLRSVLEMGYSFVFSDADIVWFRNPFEQFSNDIDFQIACDRFNGEPFSVANNAPNGGFLYARSNQHTIAMYKYWYKARLRIPGKHDQDVLSAILREEEFLRIGVKIRFLETVYFSGFCQMSNDMTRVITVHANCCKGLDKKLKDLQLVLDDFRASKNGKSSNDGKIWRAPLTCLTTKWKK